MPFERPGTVIDGASEAKTPSQEVFQTRLEAPLKDAPSDQRFYLKSELQNNPAIHGIPRIYRRRLVPVHTVGGHRSYPEGMVPVVADDGKRFLLPEDTETVFIKG